MWGRVGCKGGCRAGWGVEMSVGRGGVWRWVGVGAAGKYEATTSGSRGFISWGDGAGAGHREGRTRLLPRA